ncbi:hypothetical protein AruPA_00950 [Acidiphilium sp. PA]|uniref:hypothetical protein n=1 Tax=Acidiphilium sp. PA TaxID=2871705 RepID=UPI0022444362|nr:hypothetical protein [Acidiphilium sp. PA]MCW8305590.1 hypothetical protein [Acidiphilium sp. PA]
MKIYLSFSGACSHSRRIFFNACFGVSFFTFGSAVYIYYLLIRLIDFDAVALRKTQAVSAGVRPAAFLAYPGRSHFVQRFAPLSPTILSDRCVPFGKEPDKVMGPRS